MQATRYLTPFQFIIHIRNIHFRKLFNMYNLEVIKMYTIIKGLKFIPLTESEQWHKRISIQNGESDLQNNYSLLYINSFVEITASNKSLWYYLTHSIKWIIIYSLVSIQIQYIEMILVTVNSNGTTKMYYFSY